MELDATAQLLGKRHALHVHEHHEKSGTGS